MPLRIRTRTIIEQLVFEFGLPVVSFQFVSGYFYENSQWRTRIHEKVTAEARTRRSIPDKTAISRLSKLKTN